MAEYIEREALIDNLNHFAPEHYNALINMLIEKQPAADVVEVVHAKWVSKIAKICDWSGKKRDYYQPNSCSHCHEAAIERFPFCPNCGAKMDGERRSE